MKKLLVSLIVGLGLVGLASPTALAHVTVRPVEVGIGSFQTFSIGVPVEKDQNTVKLRLVIPEGLESVRPNVKPGWKVTVKKTGEGESAKVTELEWSEGQIPAGLRDDFLFSAKVPASTQTLVWKAYQTYQDGTVVSWDETGHSDHHKAETDNKGPASETQLINDLDQSQSNRGPLVSYLALGLSLVALALAFRRR